MVSKVVDVNGTTICEFEVPMSGVAPWYLTRTNDVITEILDADYAATSNGQLIVQLDTTVTSQVNGISPSVYCSVYVGAGSSFQFAEPIDLPHGMVADWDTNDDPYPPEAQMDMVAFTQKLSEPIFPARPVMEQGIGVADLPDRITDLLKRFTLWSNLHNGTAPIIQNRPPDYTGNEQSYDALAFINWSYWIMFPFRYYRGGVSFKALTSSVTANTFTTAMPRVFTNLSYNGATPMAITPPVVSPVLEVSVPWFNRFPFAEVNPIGGGDAGEWDHNDVRETCFANLGTNYQIWGAMADDIQLGPWAGLARIRFDWPGPEDKKSPKGAVLRSTPK
jgi:hypothetical protein